MTKTVAQEKVKSAKHTQHHQELNNSAQFNEDNTTISNSITVDIQTKNNKDKRAKKRDAKSKIKSQALIQSGMEVICEQDTFYQALAFVSCATPNKPAHPILANVLIIADVETQQIHLTATDLALTIQASFAVQVISKGEVTVPVEILFEIVKHCPNGNLTLNSQTQINQVDEDNQIRVCSLHLSDVDGNYEIKGISAEEFPSISKIDANPISLPKTVFQEGFKSVAYAISNDETKYILTGVNMQVTQESLKFVTTDGHRVAISELSTQGIGRKRRKQVVSEEKVQITVPGRVLRELARNLGDDVDSINLLYDAQSHRLGFAWQDFILQCQCLEGSYPDCEQLLSHFSFDQEVILEKAVLVKALERLSVLTDRKEKGIYLHFDGSLQQLRLSIERDFGKGDLVVGANLPREMSLHIQFNLKYLIEAAKAISSSAIKMHLKQSDSPAMLVPDGDNLHPEITMVMRHFLLPLHNPSA
jgi:DNA polymerase-3 subunit beta